MNSLNRRTFSTALAMGIGGVSFSEAQGWDEIDCGQIPSGYFIPRQVRYSFSIQNKKETVCESADFWTYAPVKQTSTQCCESIAASHPAELVNDELGNQILQFKFNDLAPYSTTLVRIKANLMLAEKPQPIPGVESERFLHPSVTIESSHPEMLKTARRFRANTVEQKAKQIHAWTVNHVKESGYVRDNRGALYALQEGTGDCTECAQLFTALARATSIPSRICGGYICTGNTKLMPQAYHNWSEFRGNDLWLLSDPNRKQFLKRQSDYIAMHILTESPDINSMGHHTRFRISGTGLKVRMED